MNRKRVLLPILLLGPCAVAGTAALAACGSAPGARERPPAATVTVASSDGGACVPRWNGEIVTGEALLDRSVDVLERGIEEVGGPEAMTEENIPFVRLEAMPEAPWSCIAGTVEALQRAGFAHIVLRPAVAPGARDRIVHFPIPFGAAGTSPVIVAVGPGGGLAWNGQATDVDGLRARLHAAAGAAMPDGHFVLPAPDASFGSLYALFGVGAEEGAKLSLAYCASVDGAGESDAVRSQPRADC